MPLFINHKLNKTTSKFIFLSFISIILFQSHTNSASTEKKITAKQLNKTTTNFIHSGNYSEAYRLAQNAIKIASTNKNYKALARALSNLASTQFYIGANEKALITYLESLEIARRYNDIEGIERVLNNLNSYYLELNKFDEAYEYVLKLPTFTNIERPVRSQIIANISMGRVLFQLNRHDQAKSYLETGKQILNQHPMPFFLVYWHLLDIDIKQSEKNYENAILSIDEAIKIAHKNDYSGLSIILSATKAELYLLLGKNNKAKGLALSALKEAEKIDLKTKQHELLSLLFEIEKSENSFQQALYYHEKIKLIAESIEGEKVQIISEITKIERQVKETEEKLQQSLQQQKISELKLETQKQAQIILAIVVAAILALILFWFHRKHTQREIIRHKQLNSELKELDKLKDRILTNTSHELRTPLNGIIGLSDIILIEYEETLDEELKHSIDLIKKSGLQLAEIINDILDFAQLKSQRMPFNYEKIDLIDIINNVIELCQPTCKKYEAEIIFTDEKNTFDIYQDKQRLRQILFNLIGNAIKFTPNGIVSVFCEKKTDLLWIHIKDNGIGIPQDKLERIFKGFEQVNPENNREQAGSGLGLAISKELVIALGGEISINSELGKGTDISFGFPIIENSENNP